VILVAGAPAFAQPPEVPQEIAPEEEKKWPKFVGVPVPIANPTFDFALGIMGMALYPMNREDEISPPSNTIAFGMYSTNESYVLLLGQVLYLKEDTWRIKAAVGGWNINSDFYGVGDGSDLGFKSPMSTGGFFAGGRAYYKVWRKGYLGAQYMAYKAGTTLTIIDQEFDIDNFESGLGPILAYDTRDNQYSATAGINLESNLVIMNAAWGSDVDYSKLDLALNGYRSITDERYVLAGRFYYEQAFGDPPFYDLPAFGSGADLRGYQYGRYRDWLMLAGQLEFRWNFYWRLHAVAFAGLGTTTSGWDALFDGPALPSLGLGVRLNMHPEERLMVRIDYAHGKEDGVFYFSVGEAF
jgi:hypothetical protein